MSTDPLVNNKLSGQVSDFAQINDLAHRSDLVTRFLKTGDLLTRGGDWNRPIAFARHRHAQGPNSSWQRQYSWLNDRLLSIAPRDFPAFQKKLQLEEITKNYMLTLVNRIAGLVEQLQRKLKNPGQLGQIEKTLGPLISKPRQVIMPMFEDMGPTDPNFKLLKLPMDQLDRLGELQPKQEQPCRLLHGSMGDLLDILFNNMLSSLFDDLNNLDSSMDGIENTDQAYAMRFMMAQFSSMNLPSISDY